MACPLSSSYDRNLSLIFGKNTEQAVRFAGDAGSKIDAVT
jgi:hypothetical protein